MKLDRQKISNLRSAYDKAWSNWPWHFPLLKAAYEAAKFHGHQQLAASILEKVRSAIIASLAKSFQLTVKMVTVILSCNWK